MWQFEKEQFYIWVLWVFTKDCWEISHFTKISLQNTCKMHQNLFSELKIQIWRLWNSKHCWRCLQASPRWRVQKVPRKILWISWTFINRVWKYSSQRDRSLKTIQSFYMRLTSWRNKIMIFTSNHLMKWNWIFLNFLEDLILFF